jgi:hypothetical protein
MIDVFFPHPIYEYCFSYLFNLFDYHNIFHSGSQATIATIKITQRRSHVQSYFYYESSELNQNSGLFYIYEYLLPRLAPHKYIHVKLEELFRVLYYSSFKLLRVLNFFFDHNSTSEGEGGK